MEWPVSIAPIRETVPPVDDGRVKDRGVGRKAGVAQEHKVNGRANAINGGTAAVPDFALVPLTQKSDADTNFHSRGTQRLRRLRDILLDGKNRLLRFMGTLVGHVSA